MNKTINVVEAISRYRNALMGIAMIWIVFTHCYKVVSLPEIIKFPIFGMGFGGVDMFLFLSGFGIYCSLSRNNDIGTFYLKRLKRLLPMLPILICYCFFAKMTSFHKIIGFLTFANFWTKEECFAFIPYMVLCYILSPIFVSILDNHLKTNIQKIGFIFLLFILSVPFWGDSLLVGMSRIPIYVVGLYVGSMFIHNEFLTKKTIIIAIYCSLIAALLLIYTYVNLYEYRKFYGLIYYCMSAFAPGFIFILCHILNLFTKNKLFGENIVHMFEYIGRRSLEIFVSDQLVIKFAIESAFFIHVCYSILGGMLYHNIYNYIQNFISKDHVQKEN